MPTATRDAKQRFATVFNFLASTKNTPVDAVKLSAYYKELAGVDIEALEATGYALGGEPSPYLPDAGTWKTRAIAYAEAQLTQALGQQVQSLAAGRAVEQEELDGIIEARNRFWDSYGRLTGTPIPPAHTVRTSVPRIPLYGCPRCRDMAWIEDEDKWARPCGCAETNPVIRSRRATTQIQRRQGR